MTTKCVDSLPKPAPRTVMLLKIVDHIFAR